MTLQQLASLGLVRITMDFDGSVQSTKRHAQGTAVGFNKKKKGARSYYPLFCTIAQTGQVFDFLHRSGNVHDSKGAKASPDFFATLELTYMLLSRSVNSCVGDGLLPMNKVFILCVSALVQFGSAPFKYLETVRLLMPSVSEILR